MTVASLSDLRARARRCRACPLWRDATQTVFGEGPADARMMLVGEQPGDHEDRSGHPFVGPAGRVLGQALEAAGIDRAGVYFTNAVKHFKFQERGKRRIHQRPAAAEVSACRPWLTDEIALIAPAVVVALGATAAQSLAGRAIPVGANRGHPLETATFAPVIVSAHPASVLRAREREARAAALAAIAADLRIAAVIAEQDGVR